MEFTTGVLRPLEQARSEWYTVENMATYFEVARDVLFAAGVVVRNPNYNPLVPYSEELLIIRPWRILSYDETKMELDCTRGGAGSRDRFIRVDNDDSETVVTKSSCSTSAACGRLGDGRALPVYILYASGDGYEASWAPDISTPDILDKDGKPLQWRYTSKLKGSVNEEFCADYIENVFKPALGYPLPRVTHPGEQGVIVCDGVGSHLCYNVIEKAIELGMEILLRVPNLGFVLQGEDTVDFKVNTTIIATNVVAVIVVAVVDVDVVVHVTAAAIAISIDVAAAAVFVATAADVAAVVVVAYAADVVDAATVVVVVVVAAADVVAYVDATASTNAATNAYDA
jgi:hypothetical protein